MTARKVITAPEQEADLPYGTVVLLADGYAAQLSHWSPGRRWHRVDSTYMTAFNETVLPALVLYEPDDSANAAERQREWQGETR
ncbi:MULTISPECIES: hypothetical protein [unclassified Leucobacter]|uniref:hypothetical protein n=1 Tax=unclassified Leucobacter TaxID=2621730 RepID=UPI0006214148|nr:hypothetical protein [Leucobacter sp. Ag1]KKI16386.1 hypothetical protein XM48_16470 [Leucobacter sp. Ag1]